MTFDEIQARAMAEWQAFRHGDETRILIGTGTCGRAAGALNVLEAARNELARRKIEAGITQVGCLGLCYAEPLVAIAMSGRPAVFYGNVTPEIIVRLIGDYIVADNPCPSLALGTVGDVDLDDIPRLFELPVFKAQKRVLLRNCGLTDPKSISHYIAGGGYSSLARALKMTPQEVIDTVKRSGLRGRGGAGFPTGLKWQFCHDAPGETKYFICNADEGDPGTFVDRTLLEGDPHSILEGMAIGGYATGASEGYIYIRGEYPLACEIVETAIRQTEELGLLGGNILASDFGFRVRVRQGAGAFICGEETALINSIEGKRGTPRVRPPFPASKGLWGQPTNVNNVETLANILGIIERGGDRYAAIGVGKSTGTKLFSLSGSVIRSGVFEVPFGITLRELIEGPGGTPDGGRLKALQPGGAMLGLVPASLIDTPIDFEELDKIGSGVGSGGMVAIDQSACVVDIARSLMDFACDEACGKCLTGMLGTNQMREILNDITSGRGQPQDIELLVELGKSMVNGAFCPLCGGASAPLLSTIRHFGDEYQAHIKDKRCPAGVCRMPVLKE